MLEELLSFRKSFFLLFIIISFSILFSASLVSAATTRYVSPGGTDSGDCTVPCLTIQFAINQAVGGDTIDVAAGNYDEQVVIDKSLTLQGAGDSTVIKPSSDAKLVTILNGNYFGLIKQFAGILVANVPSAGSITIKSLKVDGSGITAKPVDADYVAGIFYKDTGGVVDTVIVSGVRCDPTQVGKDCYGIYLSSTSSSITVEVKGSTITDFDKNGIQACGSMLTANVNDNTIIGRGPLPVGDEVQNGIVLGDGTNGNIDGNTISDMSYISTEWWTTGILFYGSGGSADNNIINDVQGGIIFQDGSGSVEDNIINGGSVGLIGLWAQYTTGGIWTVSFVDNTVSIAKDSWGYGIPITDKYQNAAIGAQTWDTGASLTVTIKENHLISASSTDADGIIIGDNPAWAAGSITATIIDNVISGWDHGIHLVSSVAYANISGNTIKNNLGSDSGIHVEAVVDATKLDVNFNNIIGNLGYGIFNGGAGILDAENNWWGSNSGPGPVGPGTGDKVSTNVDYDPWLTLDLTLTSPENKVYNTRSILIDASTSLKADKIEYSDNDPIFRRLCSNCDSYSRKKSFGEGDHTFTVKATLGSETVSKTVNFFVDSIPPRIIKILPEDEDIIHGTTFYIKYTEANLVDVSLYWKESTESFYQKVTNTSCESGTNKECTLTFDLTGYDGKMINFYFDVRDRANTATSSVRTITIDNTNPVVTINSPEDKKYSSRRIDLDIGVDEQVKTLEYSLDGIRFNRLCNNCKSYKRMTNFNDGDHTLVVRATDYAGNVGQLPRHFFVDSIPPRIIRQYPQDKKYTNGTFTITYTEQNLNKITLYYKGVLETEYKNSPENTCESGTNKECVFYVDLTSYDGKLINYYFVVQNDVSETTGKMYTVNVDTKPPIIEIISPVNEKIYDSRRVQLNIKVDELVELEYSDNGGRFRRLCSRCDSYDRINTFSYGWHGLVIRATDNADNTVTKSVEFRVENLF